MIWLSLICPAVNGYDLPRKIILLAACFLLTHEKILLFHPVLINENIRFRTGGVAGRARLGADRDKAKAASS